MNCCQIANHFNLFYYALACPVLSNRHNRVAIFAYVAFDLITQEVMKLRVVIDNVFDGQSQRFNDVYNHTAMSASTV